ncbi:MAG: DNA polymerase III subunit epsilon [Lysobacterales bacterium]
MRQVVLDTETTGLEPSQGHRVIEIGAVELVDRRLSGRQFHEYLNPQRKVDAGALEVHGLSDEFLADKPLFAAVSDTFMQFIDGAELVIHNAPFDVGFLDHELNLLDQSGRKVTDVSRVLDTLELARSMHPGMRNSLDALCRRYDVDNSRRELHGALLDASILAEVYLCMTGGQTSLSLELAASSQESTAATRSLGQRPPMRVLSATVDEVSAHQQRLAQVADACDGVAVWQRLVGDAHEIDESDSVN